MASFGGVSLEGLEPWQLAAVGAVVLVLPVVFLTWWATRRGGKVSPPPAVRCLPVVGGLMKFLNGPKELMDDLYPKYGPVFSLRVLHRPFTFLLDPTVVEHFFTGKDTEVSQKEVYEFNVPTFGKGVVYDVPIKVRDEQFRMLKDNLRTSMLKQYVGQFVEEAERFFSKWGDEGKVDLRTELAGLIILTASRTLLGKEVREHLFEQVSDLVRDLDEGMVPLSVLFPHAPIAPHRKRDRARRELGKIFAKVIQERRARGNSEADMLDALIKAHYKDGRELTEEEITGILIATLFGGQHTSSITSVWTGMHLTHSKEFLGRVLAEQQQCLKTHGNQLDMDVLNGMDELHRVVKESLRMHSPLILLMRYVHVPFDVTAPDGKTYHIGKGHTIVTSPTFVHSLPHVHKDPDTFNPDRFKEDLPPFYYMGFGGGRHTCLGQAFAYLQIKAIWSVILRNFEVEFAADGFPQPNYNAMVIGADRPCYITYKRRKLQPN